MPEGLSNHGEEQLINALAGTEVEVILYDDSTNQLDDTDGTDAITTEPSGGTTTKTITIQSSDLALQSGDWTFQRDLTYSDLTNAEGRVDAIAVSPTGSTDILWRGLTRKSGEVTPITNLAPIDQIDPVGVQISLD